MHLKLWPLIISSPHDFYQWSQECLPRNSWCCELHIRNFWGVVNFWVFYSAQKPEHKERSYLSRLPWKPQTGRKVKNFCDSDIDIWVHHAAFLRWQPSPAAHFAHWSFMVCWKLPIFVTYWSGTLPFSSMGVALRSLGVTDATRAELTSFDAFVCSFWSPLAAVHRDKFGLRGVLQRH